jgi:hypothetical protein
MPSFLGRFFLLFLIATPVLAAVVFMMAGLGHGTYVPAKILFPYTMASTALTGDNITVPFIALALLQYPLYGALLDWARAKGRLPRMLATLLVLHLVLVAAAVFFSHPAFTR